MSDFYLKVSATVARIITSKGQTMTLRRQSSGPYDPSSGSSVVTPEPEVGVGVILSLSERTLGDSTRDGDTSIRVGDKKILMATRGVTGLPLPGDSIEVGSSTWSVVNAKAVDPAGIAVVYSMHVRR